MHVILVMYTLYARNTCYVYTLDLESMNVISVINDTMKNLYYCNTFCNVIFVINLVECNYNMYQMHNKM